MKVFDMDDSTWIAADSVDDAWRAFLEHYGYDISTPAAYESARRDWEDYEPAELTDADLDRLKFHDHELSDSCPAGDGGQEDVDCPVTFRQRLERLMQDGSTFPCFFASTES